MHFVRKALRKSTSSGNKRSVPVATGFSGSEPSASGLPVSVYFSTHR